MSLLKGFKANKAISVLLDEDEATPAETQEAVSSLKEMGSKAVPKLIDALEESPTNSAILNLLGGLLDNESLHHYADGLAHPNKRVMTTIMQILAQSPMYDVNRLFELFDDPEIPKSSLLQILAARRSNLDLKRLLEILDQGSKASKQMAFRVLAFAATEEVLPHLLNYIDSPDPAVRINLVKVLAQFRGSTVARDALLRLIGDKEKHVRQAAIEAIGNLTVEVSARPLCQLLRDPDITVQNKAIEALTKVRDPETVKYLIDILQDESEYVRRAAVEVLNEIGDQSAVTDLLNALRDKDWWIRVRAADALGSIGGPRVIDAVLELIKDKDEFLRRTAVEILNSLKDDRAFDHLIAALEDEDWWVRERAADALANLGDQRAIPALLKMAARFPDSQKAGFACLQKLADKETLHATIKQADFLDSATRTVLVTGLASAPAPRASGPADRRPPPDIENAPTRVMPPVNPPPPRSPHDTVVQQAAPASPATPPAAADDNGVVDASTLEPGQIIDGRYRVIRKVGEGAFGVVILVNDEMVGEEIILKFLNPHVASDKHIIQRFIHELRYARKITHENVIRIFDFLTLGKSNAISMEYFDSHSLAYEIKAKKTGDHARMIKILIEVCNGLAYAHRAGVVHRDIKPANILINENDVVKLVDFGLAAAASGTDARLTRSGVLVGTPTYMAPEQVRDKKIDARTDIYSLGVLMYEIFTGRPPYRGKDSMAILFQHVEGKATPPKQVNPMISDELNDVIMKAMAVNPDKRYQTVDELRQALVKLALKVAS